MNKIYFVILILLLPICLLADSFDDIKKDLSKDGCWQFVFVDIIESDIFNSIDTTFGEAYMASDGRYYIKTNEDFYIFDHNYYFSYSPESNQLIIEKKQGEQDDDFSFITNFDKYYETHILIENHSFKLYKKKNITGDIPDSMEVFIKSEEKRLDRIEYYDINEELNRLIFIKQSYIDSCLDSQFIPIVPDSTERVKL
jgi:hypothetical protein